MGNVGRGEEGAGGHLAGITARAVRTWCLGGIMQQSEKGGEGSKHGVTGAILVGGGEGGIAVQAVPEECLESPRKSGESPEEQKVSSWYEARKASVSAC